MLRYKGFRFFFYSNEGSPRESVHVHVRGEGGEAKVWVRPEVRVADSDGFDAGTLRELAWFPRLLHATPKQRAKVEISPMGLHWDELDEDVSVNGLLAGRGDPTAPTSVTI